MNVIIRPATLADIEHVGAIHVRSWQETYPQLLPDALIAGHTQESRAALWRRVIETTPVGETRVVVAEQDGAIIGFGALAPQRDATLAAQGYASEITALYLLRTHQGKGGGRALVQELARLVGNPGGLSLWVLAGNDRAAGFYARLGGQIIARKAETRGAVMLEEWAYGWPDVTTLVRQEHE